MLTDFSGFESVKIAYNQSCELFRAQLTDEECGQVWLVKLPIKPVTIYPDGSVRSRAFGGIVIQLVIHK
jgi:hypothetical protein